MALNSLTISGGSSTIQSGTTSPAFIATGYDINQNLITPAPNVVWSVVLTTGQGTAAIDPGTGVLSAFKVGTVKVVATSGSISQNQVITVVGYAALSSISITGGASTVQSGTSTVAFVATAYDVYLNTISPITILWSVVLQAG